MGSRATRGGTVIVADAIDLDLSDDENTPDVVTRLDELAQRPYDRRRYIDFFIDYVKPAAYRYRVWMLSDRKYRDAAKVLDFDDIAQIGAIAAVHVCDRLEERHPDDIDPYRFSAWLKMEMNGRVRDAMEEHARKSADEIPDEDEDPRTALRAPDTAGDHMTLRALADTLREAPAALRAVAGMFLVEEMRQSDVAELLAVSQVSVSNWIRGFAIRACGLAQNVITDHPWTPDPWPAVGTAILPQVDAWTRNRYGVTAETWLGWIDGSFATDAGYLCDLYGISFGRRIRHMPAQYDLDDDLRQLDLLDPPPRTIKDVQARCGFGVRRATAVLSAWRLHNT